MVENGESDMRKDTSESDTSFLLTATITTNPGSLLMWVYFKFCVRTEHKDRHIFFAAPPP